MGWHEHDYNCGIHDAPGFSQCTCGFDPTLPIDDGRVLAVMIGYAIPLVAIFIFLVIDYVIGYLVN